MILPDVNVLVYALRSDVAEHSISRSWLLSVVSGDSRFGLSPMVLSGVVRVSTDPRIFASPSTTQEAFSFCDFLLVQPNCEVVQPGERHWAIFERLCLETNTRGRRVSDAWFAALAIEWGCEWISFDRDFRRFPGLRWRSPAASV